MKLPKIFDLDDTEADQEAQDKRLSKAGLKFSHWIEVFCVNALGIPAVRLRQQKGANRDTLDSFLTSVILMTFVSFGMGILVFSVGMVITVFQHYISAWWLFAIPVLTMISMVLLANGFAIWRTGVAVDAFEDDDN